MRPTRIGRARRPALAVAAAAPALAFPAPAVTASAHPGKHRAQPLVVRGDATVVDSPCGPQGCHLEFAGGTFRGTLGTGEYTGSFDFDPGTIFPNGEGGVCAPIEGSVTLGAGTPDRLVLAVRGDSCQDGGGDVRTSSFTTVARFTVADGTGKYAHATGRGTYISAEDAADHDRMTIVGRIAL
jgi:hypothetical protein